MIRVPAEWRCAQYDCLLVQITHDTFFLCRSVPLPYPTTIYTLTTKVRLPIDEARRLLICQDVIEREERAVRWMDRSNANIMWSYNLFGIHPGAADELPADVSKLTFHCVSQTCILQSVVCRGLRLDVRATVALLSASMMGCYVIPGSVVDTANGSYEVVQIEKKSGTGLGIVGGGCRVRLNNTTAVSVGGNCTLPSRPVGLDDAVIQIETVLSMIKKDAGKASGVLVHGPRGCGVGSLIIYCLRSQPEIELLPWSTTFDASFLRRKIRGSIVALYLPSCERFFPVQDDDFARLTLRKLLKDVNLLTVSLNGHQPSVLVVASTHQLGSCCAEGVLKSFFSVQVRLSLPDTNQRAALLAAVQGGQSADWIAKAQSLIGKTSADVLSIAKVGGWEYRLPFKVVRWGDIGGLREVKERLHRALVWPQRHPEVFKKFNLLHPKGILLYGPPGCAKTTLVKALCSEGHFSLIYLDSASVVSAHVGESERRVRDVFAQASQRTPCIVFFDEVEVIGAKRESGGHQAESVRLLSTLLTEMDGFIASHGVCFVGATNVPHLVDPALLRPGRFDYLVYVPLPSSKDREEILSLHLGSTAVDVSVLSALTEGFSGADLGALCTAALLELLGGNESLPSLLYDVESMMPFMKSKIQSFKRSNYNSVAIEEFHRKYVSV
ncbi:unnamed protein product [Phytomonas sp. Hart1]|nr:unnamed protein product [Phytomonas sp. Hart1]|eukprot:CCW68242.1 unnamed protein product [Phytomonas sp. isolate Hart1]